MTLRQIVNDPMSKILFNSLMSEETGETLIRVIQRTLEDLGICRPSKGSMVGWIICLPPKISTS